MVIVAWRYGYIPVHPDNSQHRSITELEYLAAMAAGKTVLAFLLDPQAPWPPSWLDALTQASGPISSRSGPFSAPPIWPGSSARQITWRVWPQPRSPGKGSIGDIYEKYISNPCDEGQGCALTLTSADYPDLRTPADRFGSKDCRLDRRIPALVYCFMVERRSWLPRTGRTRTALVPSAYRARLRRGLLFTAATWRDLPSAAPWGVYGGRCPGLPMRCGGLGTGPGPGPAPGTSPAAGLALAGSSQ